MCGISSVEPCRVCILVARMGTGWWSGRRMYGGMLWLVCVTTNALCMERFVGGAGEVGDRREGLRFEDWRRVVATQESTEWRPDVDHRRGLLGGIHGGEQILKVAMEDGGRKEREHRIAREKLHWWLTSTDKWHFVIGYSSVRAYSTARRLTQGAPIHHFPTRNSSVHFFLTFVSVASAEVIRRKRLFHVVEPLLPYLKMEDLALGKLIRDHEDAERGEAFALKATLAHNALSLREVKSLAGRWKAALGLESQDALLSREHTTTLRYSDTGGQMGIHPVGEERETIETDLQVRSAPLVECLVSMAAIVCSGITKGTLEGAANFMASHAVVQLVELNPRYEAFNKWAKYVTQSVSEKRLPIFYEGLRGQGEVIACADTGIDMDHCFFRDRYRAVPFNAVDSQARKVVQYTMSWGDTTDFEGGHGTHVAGSIAGDIEEGSHEFAGMAPAAKIAFFDLGSNSSNLKAPIELGKGVFEYGYMAGARIFSNSWGSLRQGYSSNSHEVDSFSYLNENVLIVFAVGNQGTLGKGTVASPASSKNCLAVGASFNAAASLASQGEDYSRSLMKPSTVAPFSSAGPTIDGRIKPDVLAPGMVVWSSVPDSGHGAPEQNCRVGPKQGTSSSTPVVAGLAALARQYFREGYYPSGKKNRKDGFIPSGALLKAVMIHSAVPEHRYVNSSSTVDLQLAPDYVEGFGLVVMEKVLVFAKPRFKHQPSNLIVLSGRRDGALAKHKSLQTVALRVTSSREPLRVTMAWMDPPAAPSSVHPMVNDLNLKLQGPDNKTVYPNGMNKEDTINNVEVIHVMKPKSGQWTVTVEGARVVHDVQPYALVITVVVSRLDSTGIRPLTPGLRGAAIGASSIPSLLDLTRHTFTRNFPYPAPSDSSNKRACKTGAGDHKTPKRGLHPGRTMAEFRVMASAQQQVHLADVCRSISSQRFAGSGLVPGDVVHVPGRRGAGSLVVVGAASNEGGEAKKDPRRPSEGIFSFVTDNDSSRNAIQLPNAPAMDGNTGQMIAQIENKGRDYGSYVRAGEFRWWVRETGTPDARNGTVVFLHGAPTQSYSYRVVLAQMAKEGYHCYAPDWIGFGFSEKPQPEYDFSYTEDAFHEELDKLIAKLDISSPFYLVTQGFIVGSYGLTWALKNPSRVKKLVAMNTPLTPSAPLPGIFQQLRFPLVGEFTCQNAILPERFVEAGSPYVLELDDADVYRLPYLDSSDPGFSLLATARKAPLKDLTTRIAEGFASPSWKVPTTVAWGMSDKHLPKSEAENFVKSNPSVLKAAMLDGAGHLPQEDWPEKVVEALTRFFY